MHTTVMANRSLTIEFEGECIAAVVALNHDDMARRIFRVYQTSGKFVAERIDNPNTIDVRYWGEWCSDALAIYEFFGNEPLANYLYGVLGITVPGLQKAQVDEI